MNIGQAAARIREAVFEDSNFFPGLHELERALQVDHAENGGSVPDEEECRALAMGGENGVVPEALKKRFPRVDRYLESLF